MANVNKAFDQMRFSASFSIIVVSVPVIIAFMAAGASLSVAATIELFPKTADCNEEFENVANTLTPGDELILHEGIYSQNCRRAITANGTAQNPIIIRAADNAKPLLTRPDSNLDTQNNIEIVDSSYLVLRGLRFKGGSTGVRFIRGHHISLEDSEIYETGNNAIAMNSGDSDSFIIRRNHIHHTGLSTSSSTEGEGMYLGCNNNTCRVSNSLIEGNLIHHLRGTSDGGNDGIEVKVGSYGNIIRNNVIHDTTIGKRFPCIFVYGGGQAPNIVEGNVMWNCGEAIQVVADATVRNNIILNSDVGITSAPHVQVATMRNVSIVNNTIYGHRTCLFLRWASASNMTLANNAVYCPGAIAVDAGGSAGASQLRANFVEGGLSGISLDSIRILDGGEAATTFADPVSMDLWPRPGSVLIGMADVAFVPNLDFNEHTRTVLPYDVGAYETDGLTNNPGWRIQSGMKPLGNTDGVAPAPPANLTLH